MCKGCVCATCVFNPNYAINTPQPCPMVDCDICEDSDCKCFDCNGCMSIDDINKMIKKDEEL